MIKAAHVDAILDTVAAGQSPAKALADMLDEQGDWDWADESEHVPCDRLAVVESSGAYWLVYRGTESDAATRYASAAEAYTALREQSEAITG
jgi:hypothetical protein